MLTTNHGQKSNKNLSLEENSQVIALDLSDEADRKYNILTTVNKIEFDAEALND